MLDKVLDYMEKYGMIELHSHILVGVSGGADSICLLDILDQLKDTFKLKITVVHIEHGVRGEASLRDMAFVESFCQKRGISCITEHHDMIGLAKEKGLSEEEAGRIIRYDAFDRIAKEVNASKIAVAHHGNDLAETMLFFLSRGTSLAGLAPMRPVRDRIIRPLLCVSRSEIEDYLKERGLSYCEDATNQDLEYARNRIRHQVLPELAEVNEQCVAHFASVSESYLLAEEVLNDAVSAAYSQYVEKRNEMEYAFSKELLSTCRRYVCYEVLKMGITNLTGRWKDVTKTHLEMLYNLFGLQVGRQINLPYGLIACRDYDGICLLQKDTFEQESKDEMEVAKSLYEVLPKQQTILLSDGKSLETRWISGDEKKELFPSKTYTKWFDYGIIKDNLVVRHAKDDDFMVINGDGGRKKIKKLFVDMKVPCKLRNQIWCLASGNQVFWAIGLRMSEDAKVCSSTEKIIEITLHGGETNE